jgi:predicted ATPase
MIHSLHLKNFKPFEDQLLEFRPLTLLSGLNGMGKSSVLQSLLLLRQSYQQRLLQRKRLALNGDLVRIGTAKDALFESAVKPEIIGFKLIVEHQERRVWEWSFRYDEQADVIRTDIAPITQELREFSLFGDCFHYLQAERLGPRNVFEMSDYLVRQHYQIGTRGEYAEHFLHIFGDWRINTVGLDQKASHKVSKAFERPKQGEHSKLSHPKSDSELLKNQVEAWMGEISPGTKIHLTPIPGVDLMSLQYSFKMGKEFSNLYRATNVGFGITYTLPIIVAVLASPPGTLILIENPEAHLHPRGQSKMGELLALAASCGVQVVIETHSDHILNGICIAVHGGKLRPEDLQLHYFHRQKKQDQAFIEVVSPRINRRGRIDKWPDGFFDEWDKNMELLLEPVGE